MAELIPMNANRLNRLADLLIKDAANPQGVKFNMNKWAGDDVRDTRESYPIEGDVQIKVDCGTQACAFGLAAISGEFKSDGLGFKIEEAGWYGGFGMLVPTYGDLIEYNAAMAFFGLTNAQASFLFGPENYPYLKQTGAKAELEVVNRIKFLLNGNDPGSYLG